MQRAPIVAALVALALAPGLAPAQEAEPSPPPEPLPAEPAVAGASRSVDELLGDLRSPVPAERVAALRALGERGDPAAVRPIADLLRDDSSVLVRGWAVRTLAQLGTAAATEALSAAAVADPDQRVRSLAARMAGPGGAVAPPSPPAPDYERTPIRPTPAPRPRPTAGQALRVSGWVTFAAAYGIALITGTILMPFGGEEAEHGWKLLLPVVGPAIAAATAPLDDEWERQDWAPASVFLWIFTGIQATGIILLSIGYAQRAAERSAAEDRDEDELGRGAAPGLVVGAGPGGLPGLSLAGWF